MVLGLRSKPKRGAPVKLDFSIHVKEVNPWPPSPSLRAIRSVLLVWVNGDRKSGSRLAKVGPTSIEFNESFTLSVTLTPEKKAQDKLQKNFLNFYLYGPYRKDKTSKGNLLGTSVVNLADFRGIEESVTTSVPLISKNASKSSEQPRLFITIQPFYKENSLLQRISSADKEEQVSIADSVNEDNDDRCEIAYFMDDDDDVSSSLSHSSLDVTLSSSEAAKASSSLHEKDEVDYERDDFKRDDIDSDTLLAPVSESFVSVPSKGLDSVSESKALLSSEASTSNVGNPISSDAPLPNISERSMAENEFIENLHTGLEERKDIMASLESKHEEEKIPLDNPPVSVQESLEQKERHADSEVTNSLLISSLGDGVDVKEDVQIEQEQHRISKDDLNVDFQNPQKKEMRTGHPEKEAKFHYQTNDEWKTRIAMLEEELREVGAVELSLYSIVAEHSSSSSKVHAPARRLSRFIFHAFKNKSQKKQASSIRTAVSGLAIVSKACGNDVPRLTFWLSNTIMLRAIVNQATVATVDKNNSYMCSIEGETKGATEDHTDWGHMEIFNLALEQVEAWIFSRIVESVWWQTFTPHMQRSVVKAGSISKASDSMKGNMIGFGGEERGSLTSFSIDLWKKVFGDACERLCPLQAEGHECGCLPMLTKLVMEQLVRRLDVAMFNAILRESNDEMPTDPVSDPISNPKVLPIPVGKLTFGAGVQLKNAIGNWSRWLSDLFEAEDDSELSDSSNTEDRRPEESRKPFRLLNALSDLMMIPFEMLADPLTRKEVCPTFSPSLVKIILSLYMPDEFSPNPVPQKVLEALDSEDDTDASVESITGFPCTVAPTVYPSLTAASLTRF
ncbi:unnamed protein product, partial [Cuscuta europaea]